MTVGLRGRGAKLRFRVRWRVGRGPTAHVEAVLHEGDAQAGTRPVLGRVRGMQEVGEQKADELEGHADHAVPHEAENGADGEAVNVDFVRGHSWGEDGGFPVWGGSICGGLFVSLGRGC